MKTTYTKGRWRVGTQTGNNANLVQTKNRIIAQVYGIPMNSNLDEIDPASEGLANARLIAAAPALLEALVALDAYLSKEQSYEHGVISGDPTKMPLTPARLVRAVIALAQ